MLQQNFEIIKEFDEEQIVALCQSDKKIYPAKFRLCFPTDVSECAKLFLNAEELNGLLKDVI